MRPPEELLPDRRLRPYWIDLHLHTVLSPCSALDMGAPEVAARYRGEGIELVAVTDHNHAGNFPAFQKAAEEKGPVVLPGMEIQSMEDIHLVVIFPTAEAAQVFQQWLWRRMPHILNKEDVFGYQLLIDHENNILAQEPILLVQGVRYTVDELALKGIEVGALVIPAHLDRPSFSYEAVLGRLPDGFPCSALEISPRASHAELEKWKERYPKHTLVRSSDAHKLEEISRSRCTPMLLAEPSFEEVQLALKGERGRKVLFP